MKILLKSHFLANQLGVFGVDLGTINFDDDDNFHDDDPGIHVRLLARRNKFEECKALKKQ